VLVRVSGDLDLASVPQLRSSLADQIGQGHARLVLDLSQVTFCDSTTLGVFVGAHRQAAAADGGIEFRHSPAALRHLLIVSGLDRVLCVT
jgi:anti-anti-sigma factor